MSSALKTPIRPEDVRHFKVGDVVYISGVIYTARDKAHAKILSDSQRPFSLRNACIYHSGPLIVKDGPVSYTHLRAHETGRNLVCRLLLEKKKKTKFCTINDKLI